MLTQSIVTDMSEDAIDSLHQNINIRDEKSFLRKQQRHQVAQLCASSRQKQSSRILDQWSLHPEWQQAHCIMGFIPMSDEPNIFPILQEALEAGHTVCLPRFSTESRTYHAAQINDLDHDLIKAKFGVLEPKTHCKAFDLSHMDLTLVPGLAFDRHGWRLGRGKGYYDRLLVGLGGIRIGVAFDFQWIESVPNEPLDQKMDWIITPEGVIKAEGCE